MADRHLPSRPLVALAGLSGAAGVALAAAGTHTGQPDLGVAANFLLFHAPALLGLGLLPASRIGRLAAICLVVGLALFAGDLCALTAWGRSPLPIAAPAGGLLLIAGWLLLCLAGIIGWRRDS